MNYWDKQVIFFNTKEYNLGGHVMSEIDMRKAFEQMLGDIDVRMFLKASPL